MPSSVQKPEDWSLYEAEIRSLYLDQNWTLSKTMKHMELKYGFKATVRQYKRRFNKNKNLTSPEWIVIGKLIEKRSREGKRTDVLLYQRRVDPKKITRELARRKLQIDRAKTPAYGRTSFRTPPPSPGMGRIAPSEQDDTVDLPHETYVAMSPGDSICSVSWVLRSDKNDHDMEHFFAQLSTPSAAPSEISYDDLNQLDIAFWTFDLPIAQLQNYLREQRHESSTALFSPFNPTHTVNRFISHSWSEDSLRYLLSEDLPQAYDVLFPAGVSYRKATNALEIALFVVTNNLSYGNNSLDFKIRVLKWLIEPAHLALLDSLKKLQNKAFSGFAQSFLQLSLDVFHRLDDDERRRLIDIIHNLVSSRLPSEFFMSFRSNVLFSIVSGYGSLDFVKLMVENRASFDPVNFHSDPDWNPLYLAARNRRLDILQYLINQGADINFENRFIQFINQPLTVLGCALEHDAYSWDPDLSEDEPTSVTLLHYGADINCRAFSSGATALEWAVFNAPPVYDMFIEHDQTIQATVPAVSLIGRAAHGGPQAIISAVQQHIYSRQNLEQTLIFAVHVGSIQVARALLQADVNPNFVDLPNSPIKPLLQDLNICLGGDMRYEDLYKPLSSALYHGDWELVGLLIDFGAEITARDIDILWERLEFRSSQVEDCTKVIWTIAQKYNEKLLGDLLLLVTYFADQRLMTSLLEMIEAEDFRQIAMQQLFIRPRRIGVLGVWFDCLVWTPLQMALVRGDVILARRLWDYGFRFHSHPDYLHSIGRYELELACDFLTPSPLMRQLIDIFLEHGAIPSSPPINRTMECIKHNCISPFSLNTCLHSILRQPHSEFLSEVSNLSKRLIEYGADLGTIAVIGIDLLPSEKPQVYLRVELLGTVLQTACFYGLTDVVRLLVSVGTDVHAAPWPQGGRTSLQAACDSRAPSLELIHYLLDLQCDVNAPPAENFGVTALQAAAGRGYVLIAIKLLTAGADVNAPAGKIHGQTAIAAAAEYGRLDMVKLLVNAGALGDIDADNRFHEAIRLADLQGHQHVADLLREHE